MKNSVKKIKASAQSRMSIEAVREKIFLIRGKKVMFDSDLAYLYGVKTRALNQAVQRNLSRFPSDFMFQLSKQEGAAWKSRIGILVLKSQIVTSNKRGGRRYLPYVFTEQGVAMLSSVLRSERAIQVNIQIMRTFTKLREILASNKELREKVEKMEGKYEQQFKLIFETIGILIQENAAPKKKIGFLNKTAKDIGYNVEGNLPSF